MRKRISSDEVRAALSSERQEYCPGSKEVRRMKKNPSPVKAIHAFCRDRCVVSPRDLKKFGGDRCLNGGCDEKGVCWFFKYRHGTGRPSVKTIRQECQFCQNDSADLIRECHRTECPLHTFRMGENPDRQRDGQNVTPGSIRPILVESTLVNQNPMFPYPMRRDAAATIPQEGGHVHE